MNLKEYPDRDLLFLAVADALVSGLKNALLNADIASLAVPGGTTPGPVFDLLKAVDLEWSRVHVMLTDERWVPDTDSRSNTALIHKRLLDDRAAAARFVPFYHDGLSAEEGCAAVQDSLNTCLPVSVMLLGMGADMHTASLFPGANGLASAMAPDAAALCPVRDPGQDIARVTLSAAVLKGALDVHVLITGEEKRAALERAMGLDDMAAPIRTVLPNATIHWAP